MNCSALISRYCTSNCVLICFWITPNTDFVLEEDSAVVAAAGRIAAVVAAAAAVAVVAGQLLRNSRPVQHRRTNSTRHPRHRRDS